MTDDARSVAFDRAASFYDNTRTLSPDAAQHVNDLLAAELGGRGRALEIGVGTGRIALPLAAAGVPLVGVDLSRPMLDRLIEKTNRRPPFPLVIADATRLPFRGGAFGAAYAAHVLHLIPAWRDAVGELVRVVRSGGTVLIDIGMPPSKDDDEPIEAVTDRFTIESGLQRRHPGLEENGAPALDDAFAGLGARVRVLPGIREERRLPLDGWIQLLRGNVFSWTWPLDDATRNRAADATLAWARERFGDLSEPRDFSYTVQWRAYDLP